MNASAQPLAPASISTIIAAPPARRSQDPMTEQAIEEVSYMEFAERCRQGGSYLVLFTCEGRHVPTAWRRLLAQTMDRFRQTAPSLLAGALIVIGDVQDQESYDLLRVGHGCIDVWGNGRRSLWAVLSSFVGPEALCQAVTASIIQRSCAVART